MMIYTKVICISVLCILGVHSQGGNDATAKNKNDSKPITKPTKVSEFFIGDLLRTSEKDQIESASSISEPVATTPEYLHPGIMTAMPDESRLISNYEIEGRGYLGEESLPPNSRSFHGNPVDSMENTPVNVYEKFLIKQAGILERNVVTTEGAQPISARYSHPIDRSHHKKEDCKKHLHPVPSSEERYERSERGHYHSDRGIPSHADDYRNSPSTYHHNYDHDDSHQVDSHASTASSYPSRSKSYASAHDSDSKSHSADSYTRSKSTSTSKTVEPDDKRAKVHVFSTTGSQNYKRDHQRRPQNEEVVAYKVRDRPSHSGPPSDGRPVRYTNSPADEAPATQYHQEYSPQAPRKHSPKLRSRPSSHPAQRPVYNDHYEGKESPYDASKESHSAEYDSRETYNAPHIPQGYQRPESGSDGRGREQHYGSSNPAEAYNAQQSPKSRRKHHHTSSNYRVPEDNSNKHSHHPQQQGQSFRPRNERPPTQYTGYPAEDPRGGRTPNYERNPSGSPERKPQGYAYDQTPHGNGGQYQTEGRSPTRESRSSTQYVEPGRTQSRDSSSIGAPVSQALITKESNPPQSRSVSYSESTYNMGGPVRSKSMSVLAGPEARNYEKPQKMVNPLHREEGDLKARGQSFQASYKPYNSEYPATYMNDQYHHDSHSAEDSPSSEEHHRPYENHEEYDENPEKYEGHSNHKGSTKTKSDITGYKEQYDSHEPLELDEQFFQKYGISKKAKVIVATAMEPNLFVADGTGIKEGETNEDSREEKYHEEEQPYERKPIRETDDFHEKPQSFGPQNIPGSFAELVGSNPRFLRNSAFDARNDNEDVPGYDPSLDELVFRSGVGDPKKVVSSQGGRQIVQMHGDGVSKIIFNKAAASEKKEQYKPKDANENFQAARSERVEVMVKGDKKVAAPVSSTSSA